jgi:hypothetical protein
MVGLVRAINHGKPLQRELGGSGAYVDAIVEQVASKRLRRCEPGKKSKPN